MIVLAVLPLMYVAPQLLPPTPGASVTTVTCGEPAKVGAVTFAAATPEDHTQLGTSNVLTLYQASSPAGGSSSSTDGNCAHSSSSSSSGGCRQLGPGRPARLRCAAA
jgi:hypothetical protein